MLLINYKTKFLSLLFLLTLFQISCTSSEHQEATKDGLKEKKNDGTAEMIKLIRESVQKLDPMKTVYFANSERAVRYRKIVEQATEPVEQLKGQLFYSNELLKAGQNEDAIMVLENLLRQLEQMNYKNPPTFYQINRLRALAYIRLGEQNNCIERYNEDRCILPFEGEGIYEMQQSVRVAIDIYKKMLEEKPEDYEAIWMLNFAYMSLGEYPEKVPSKWRLDKKAFESDYQIPKFQNIAHKLGINTLALSGGTCVDDFNNDGFLDIIASSWGLYDQIRFFKNNGDGTFTDMTGTSKLAGLIGGLNINHCDYNNDGWLDIFVLRGAWFEGEGKIPNSLIRNNGDGTFTDVTIEAGLLSYAPTQTSNWADFNKDGWLDVFIGNESSSEEAHFPCELFINNGDGTFSNKIDESGLENIAGMVKGVTSGDINNDGLPDLYLSFLRNKNRLFINNGTSSTGAVSFQRAQAQYQIGEPKNSFPCWFWDYNNDGWEDIFVAAFGFLDKEGPQSVAAVAAMNFTGKFGIGNPRLYKNNGDGSFTDQSTEMGLLEGMYAMGSNYGDIDNDGWLDFYLGTGEPSYTAVVPNKMFRNNRGKTFQDVTTSSGLGHVQKGHGVGFGDFDNDGDEDIFCVLGGAYEGDVFGDALFLNPIGQEKSWVTLILEGTESNRSAIGARVKITALAENGQEIIFYRTVSTGSSFGANSLQLETGLGDAIQIKEVTVQWPNQQNTTEVFENIEINKVLKLKEGSGQAINIERKRFSFST
ncbi:CRTAC1 family protein [Saprospiraceae bacterium]|nr:CRTAC1 family protein [Saprospiraceae bacterium]